MAVFMTIQECRRGFWHVVTYDTSDPENWVETEDLPTNQPCDNDIRIIGIRRADATGPAEKAASEILSSLSFKPSASPVIWPFRCGELRWQIPKSDATTFSGPLVVTKDGIEIQTGSATATVGTHTIAFGITIKQAGRTLTHSVQVPLTNPEACPNSIPITAKTNDWPYQFKYFPSKGTTSEHSIATPEIASLLKGFDFSHFSEMSSQLSKVIPVNAELMQRIAVAMPVAADGAWGRLSGYTACIGLAALISSCAGGILPCCAAMVPAAIAYTRCLEQVAEA